jgi:hypothetical protein
VDVTIREARYEDGVEFYERGGFAWSKDWMEIVF